MNDSKQDPRSEIARMTRELRDGARRVVERHAVTETQTVDLAAWPTPPCPKCGQEVTALLIDTPVEDFFGPAKIAQGRTMYLAPCAHVIGGYTVQGDVVEWMPYV
jgi:hypothetical protein